MSDANKSLSRGLRILRTFNQHSRPSLAQLSAAADIPKPTALRYLQTLIDEGYVALDTATKRYSLRPRVVDLGMAALGSLGVPRQMESEIERLAVVSGGSAHLGVLDGTDVIIVARNVAPAERRRFVTMQLYVGSRLPAHCSALGRILLANAPEAAAEAIKPENIVRLTPLTETDPARIANIVTQARSDGYATIEEELALGYCAIAIRLGTFDKIDYALSISMPSNEFNKHDLVERMLPLLLETTKHRN
ncbi:IclR family transcriptional regulator [Mesorhizobium sp. ANAO-SY3R2]|uniref:IclR family transcriptional regulator n=1 Tax=Mesorhizobium sp. ANAO-SY3R2 TaxID=3166644 RepID=UPI00366D103B